MSLRGISAATERICFPGAVRDEQATQGRAERRRLASTEEGDHIVQKHGPPRRGSQESERPTCAADPRVKNGIVNSLNSSSRGRRQQ